MQTASGQIPISLGGMPWQSYLAALAASQTPTAAWSQVPSGNTFSISTSLLSNTMIGPSSYPVTTGVPAGQPAGTVQAGLFSDGTNVHLVFSPGSSTPIQLAGASFVVGANGAISGFLVAPGTNQEQGTVKGTLVGGVLSLQVTLFATNAYATGASSNYAFSASNLPFAGAPVPSVPLPPTGTVPYTSVASFPIACAQVNPTNWTMTGTGLPITDNAIAAYGPNTQATLVWEGNQLHMVFPGTGILAGTSGADFALQSQGWYSTFSGGVTSATTGQSTGTVTGTVVGGQSLSLQATFGSGSSATVMDCTANGPGVVPVLPLTPPAPAALAVGNNTARSASTSATSATSVSAASPSVGVGIAR